MTDLDATRPAAAARMRAAHVAMVTPRFAPFTGGIETHVREVAKRLMSLGLTVTVLTTDPKGKLLRTEEVDGIVVKRFSARASVSDLYFAPGLYRDIAQGPYDLVHIQGAHTLVAPLAMASAHRRGLPTVLSFHTGGHSSGLRRSIRDVQWRAERKWIAQCDRLIGVCEFEIDHFKELLGLPCSCFTLVRNGAEAIPAEGVADESGSPLVLSIGRLERYKGHQRAIAAFPHVMNVRPGALLVIVGDGPYRKHLEDQVHELDIEASVSFRSYGPNERGGLGALVASADVVALLSDYEAHPVAVMEALAAGKDVVAADTSGLTELGRSGLISLVDRNADPADVAEVVVNAADEHRWAHQHPDLATWQDCTSALAQTYAEVLGCGS